MPEVATSVEQVLVDRVAVGAEFERDNVDRHVVEGDGDGPVRHDIVRVEGARPGATATCTWERSGDFEPPAPGALSYMLSKRGYLSDDGAGPWLPHLMFFVTSSQAKLWGSGLKGSPIIGEVGDDTLGSTVVMIPVRRWSDGTPAPPPSS